ncbi:hypothetical protein BX616_004018 [Lobosporangium transversale]|uniref:Uncharacterized protein n=1 Tax=Lobosporangium transversale TaxID=64571 RepID=A0A1Y2H4Z3_9FUNG|nr:hypothetical protein BCR41DRAFT_382920 [Lobosporangium transversale]KAF9898449.1 hypothetical protein BX616_004018 [Lobosporangium transversale]ORZ29051.1 hypothetical protein BCR41DRAFT_382920 [Lobosporangium transversale]|eukprot:XP_021886724.1 hypothetical protein BCR41DRAFT_382920 [Lobosporangium transversale]
MPSPNSLASSRPINSSLRRSRRSIYLIVAGCLMTCLSVARADILCSSPNSGSFEAGQPLVLDWSSDASSPKVADIVSMRATLVCDTGVSIANTEITTWASPFTWTVPNVGNATVPGGTTGTCLNNSFHVFYEGEYWAVRNFFKKSYRAECKSITILPAPNVTPTTTTLAPTTTTTSGTTSRRASKSASTSASPESTDPSTPDSEDSQPKTFVIVIVAIMAGLVLFLVAFGTWWYLRKQRIKRMENAIMPWSSQSNNQFSKVPSMDEGHRDAGVSSPATVAGVVSGAAVARTYTNKPQPQIPQPTHGYYQEGGHKGYGQQGAGGGYGDSNNGYDAPPEDEYYNPYYAQGRNQGYGQGHIPGGMNTADQYHAGSYQQSSPPQQHHPGYFPPPPPVNANAHPMSPSVNMSPTSVPNNITTTTLISTATTSSGRSPQAILPEKGHPVEEKGYQEIPMRNLGPSS